MDHGQLRCLVLDGSANRLAGDSEREAALRELTERLQSGKKVEQVLAAEELARFGDDAVTPLCEALENADDDIRAAAAHSLGIVGDPRAVEPLIRALRGRCVGGSGRKHRKSGLVFVCVLASMVIVFPVLLSLVTGHTNGAVFGGLVGPLVAWYSQRSLRGKTFRAVTRALEQIAEVGPTPEVREVLPELKVLASDPIQQDRETRDALRAAASRIDTLTAELGTLPIAASAPTLDVTALPAPAYPGALDPESLPRIVT